MARNSDNFSRVNGGYHESLLRRNLSGLGKKSQSSKLE